MFIRTNKFVRWIDFIEQKSEVVLFALDFEIDAGFSFCTAISNRMMQKGKRIIPLDETINLSKIDLILNYPLSEIEIEVKNVKIVYVSNESYKNTDRYIVSVTFSLLELNYEYLNKMLNEDGLEKPSSSEDIRMMVLFSKFFGEKASRLMDEIISHIELSGFYVRQVPASFNLYINYDKIEFFRVTQKGDGGNSSGENPIHPLLVRSKSIISSYENNLLIPNNIKKHYKKGIHYRFLGFYDESFLCFYKIVELIFKESGFSKKLTKMIFNSDLELAIGAIKSSNQKTMMLFIYQFIMLDDKYICSEKNELMRNMILMSDLRNKIAHSSDQSEESRRMLPSLISLSNFMILSRS